MRQPFINETAFLSSLRGWKLLVGRARECPGVPDTWLLNEAMLPGMRGWVVMLHILRCCEDGPGFHLPASEAGGVPTRTASHKPIV